MSSSQRPFEGLDPSLICDAVESLDLVTDGRLLALNSYENRVWQVGIEAGQPLIAKFYRPGRWSDEAIVEEHGFTRELSDHGLSVVAPLVFNDQTLHRHHDFRFALFPRRGGHAPELAHRPTLEALGRVLGRMHAIGASDRFKHRRTLSIDEHGHAPVAFLLGNDWLPGHLQGAFEALAGHLLEAVEATWARAAGYRSIRLHGDCHPGNILWRDETAHFVDLDDCLTGPAVQDLWMLISGEPDERSVQLGWLLDGYRMFHHFNPVELHLIEPLRCLRMLHHQAWLARRWEDPAFPMAFPWFTDARHWENVMQQLREQLDELQQPPVQLPDY